jgi:hypothetical protein
MIHRIFVKKWPWMLTKRRTELSVPEESRTLASRWISIVLMKMNEKYIHP